MSPFHTTLSHLVERFAISPARKEILAGYLQHRSALLALGLTGLQWIDGSFLEDIESLEGRDPGDIDVVTFTVRPAHLQTDQVAWDGLLQNNQHLFVAKSAKAQFKTDSYFVDITSGPGFVIQQTAYWFGLFSHRRVSRLWKGILQVWLDSQQDDASAQALLAMK